MGRDSGYIAVRSAIAGGAEGAMLPEKGTTDDDVINYIKENIRREKTFSIIVVAEKDSPGNSVLLAEKAKKELKNKDIRVTILGHIQRGGAPTAADRILASRLGLAAVEAIIDGHKNEMVGIVHDEVTHIPLKDSIEKTKPFVKDLTRLIKILSL